LYLLFQMYLLGKKCLSWILPEKKIIYSDHLKTGLAQFPNGLKVS
jgi:hypothetical protein